MDITAQDGVHTRENQNDIQMTICLERNDSNYFISYNLITFVDT